MRTRLHYAYHLIYNFISGRKWNLQKYSKTYNLLIFLTLVLLIYQGFKYISIKESNAPLIYIMTSLLNPKP